MSGMMSELAEWDSFYGIVGSAAGALIGLQFVVMTLVAQRPPIRAAEAGAAFATPTIVHFAAALLLSCCAAFGGVRNPCAVALRGSLPHARGPVWCWSCSAAVALHRHSQRLGRRRLSCIRQCAGAPRRNFRKGHAMTQGI